jgi:uncharacterized damage-inducible protein DinB
MSDTANPILTEFFRHNLWANLALIDFLTTVPDIVLETDVPGTFGTVRDTLTHLVGAEELYLRRLRGDPGRRDPALYETNPDLATLREIARQSGQGLIAYAAAVVGDPTLHETRDGAPHQLPASLRLLQALNHATDHRTQIKTALTQAGFEPPELDGWTWDESGSRES